MHDGYVLLYRRILDSQVFQNIELLKVWIWCLLKASYKDRWVSISTGVGQTEVFLKRGQFLFGRKTAAKELKMKPSSIRNRILKLQNIGNLDIQPDTHYTVVTIANWDSYQTSVERLATQADTHLTPKGQPQDTNNKVIKPVNKENTPLKSPKRRLTKVKSFLLENIPEEFNGINSKIIEFFEYRQQKPKDKRYHSTKAIKGLFRDLDNCQAAGYDLSTCLDIAMEREWQTPSVDYFKPEMFRSVPAPSVNLKTDEEQIKEFLS